MKHNIDTTDEILGRMLHTTAKLFKELLGENLISAGFNFTVEEVITMAVLSSHEGQNQQAITNFINCEKTAMTRIIDKLEQLKLVTRVQDKEDRRQNMIFLTKLGRKTVEKMFVVAKETEKQAFSGITASQVKNLKETLLKVRKNLNFIVED